MAWQKFEQLVADIHRAVDPRGQFDVIHGERLVELFGAGSQVDVLLRPKHPFHGPVLVSCKSSAMPVGIVHVREWSDVVSHHGAAAGAIVSPTGFTSEAILAAKDPTRRLTLWVPRPLNLDDFAPDDRSATGYIASVQIRGVVTEWRPRSDTLRFDLEAVGPKTGRQINYTFSAAARDAWYLRDDEDNVVGNVWDTFVAADAVLEEPGEFRFVPAGPQFIVMDGVRFRFNALGADLNLTRRAQEFRSDPRG